MPLIRCSECGEDTLTFSGLSSAEHCAGCGRPLGSSPIETGAALDAKLRLERSATASRAGSKRAPTPASSSR